MSSGLSSGVSGLALGTGLYRDVSGLWGGASGLISGFGFSPALLFAQGEPGGWYDPSDLSTMFQDSAGTTPVTATGQTVGLVLDKSQGLVLGPQLVTNGNFSQGTTGWIADSGCTLAASNGVLTVTTTADNTFAIQQNNVYQTNKTYQVTFTYRVNNTTTARLRSGATTLWSETGSLTNKTVTVIVFPTTTQFEFGVTGGTVTEFYISNISVRELPGNHLTQANLANRPIYGIEPFGGRRNLLTYTEEFGNATWVKTRATISNSTTITASETNLSGSWVGQTASGQVGTNTLSVDVGKNAGVVMLTAGDFVAQANNVRVYLNTGTGVIGTQQVNGTGFSSLSASVQDRGSAWRLSISYTSPTAVQFQRLYLVDADGSLAVTIGRSAVFSFPQFELGSTATAYQSVTDQWNVTQAGVPSVSYVQFDGSDDFYISPTITPGIDKAQVFAGVRKLADAGAATVVESSTTATTSPGSFFLRAPQTNSATYSFVSSGSTSGVVAVSPATFAAPITDVITGLGDIAAPSSIIRVNGTQEQIITSTQGTGNYLAYPLYVGRRGGTTLPYNGRIYQLIVRFGANLPLETIQQTEAWVNGKTGAY